MDPVSGYRFGGFVFDPSSGDLKDAGTGVTTFRLQPQVAALLSALLERPGTVVSRVELQARLWPDTTVDFDDGLNFCVRQLRLALGDDAGAPKFVETLARRGYRFIAPVLRVESASVTKPSRSRAQYLAVGVLAALLVTVTALMVSSAWRGQPAHTGAALAVVPFRFDETDSTMVAYQRQLLAQLNAGVRTRPAWDVVSDTSAATHVLSGALKRRGVSVEVFVMLVRRSGRRNLWADSILDSYPFSGNSTLTADRITRSVSRLLQADTTAATPK